MASTWYSFMPGRVAANARACASDDNLAASRSAAISSGVLRSRSSWRSTAGW